MLCLIDAMDLASYIFMKSHFIENDHLAYLCFVPYRAHYYFRLFFTVISCLFFMYGVLAETLIWFTFIYRRDLCCITFYGLWLSLKDSLSLLALLVYNRITSCSLHLDI